VLRKVDASGMASAAHAASKKRTIAMVDPNKPINVGGVSSGGKDSRIKFDLKYRSSCDTLNTFSCAAEQIQSWRW